MASNVFSGCTMHWVPEACTPAQGNNKRASS